MEGVEAYFKSLTK